MSSTIIRIRRANAQCDLDDDVADAIRAPLFNPLRNPPTRLTDAQIRSANSAPPLIMPGIAGFILMPFSVAWILQVGSAFSANPTWALRYEGIAADIHSNVTPTLNAPGYFNSLARAMTTLNSSMDARGKGLVWRASANITGGAMTSNRLHVWCLALEA